MEISYIELYNLVNKSLEGTVPLKTFDSLVHRKTIKGVLLEKICEILNITIKEINELKSNLIILASDTANIDWLYNSLTIEEQSAICYFFEILISE